MKNTQKTVVALVLMMAMLLAGCGRGSVTEMTTTTDQTTTTTATTKTSETTAKTTLKKTAGTTTAAPQNSIFTDDILADTMLPYKENSPIKNAMGTLNPQRNEQAVQRGVTCAAEITQNHIADFEKNIAYCEKNGGDPDKMVHVSTFTVIDGMVYMTYYANTGSDAENPKYQEARLAYCPLSDPSQMTVKTIQKVGEPIEDDHITMVYDTILMHKDDKELYIMWTASTIVQYYRFYRVFDLKTKTLGPVQVNRFRVGDVTNDFSISGIRHALSANNIKSHPLASDIGIMQKLSTRVENGVTYYYTGVYSHAFNAIIKSRDLITWEYVASPTFDNQSEYENAVYVMGDTVYYFVRQEAGVSTGFLTAYNLVTEKWASPLLITDAQSRSDFIEYGGELYLIHAPIDRKGFGIVKIDRNNLSNSQPILVVDMQSSCFYPYAKVYGDDVYISYTVDRKHIRLSKFNLKNYLS